jgi:hypothetical protein
VPLFIEHSIKDERIELPYTSRAQTLGEAILNIQQILVTERTWSFSVPSQTRFDKAIPYIM